MHVVVLPGACNHVHPMRVSGEFMRLIIRAEHVHCEIIFEQYCIQACGKLATRDCIESCLRRWM